MNNLKTTNILLLIIAIPILFYVLKLLSFIFIPLAFSVFIAILFWPLIRWLQKKKVPKVINLLIVFIIIGFFTKTTVEIVKLSSKEILESDSHLFEKAEDKLGALIIPIEEFLGIKRAENKSITKFYFMRL